MGRFSYPTDDLTVSPADLVPDGDLERLDLAFPVYMTAFTFRDDMEMINASAVDLDFYIGFRIKGYGDTADSMLLIIGTDRDHVAFYDRELRAKEASSHVPFSRALQMVSGKYEPEKALLIMVKNCCDVSSERRKFLVSFHSFANICKGDRPWSIGEIPTDHPSLAK
jgi:hypothetical protein